MSKYESGNLSPLELTRRGKFCLRLGVLAAGAGLAAAATTLPSRGAPEIICDQDKFASVSASDGQTLWQMADQAYPGTFEDNQQRSVMDQISARNNGAKTFESGQPVVLPFPNSCHLE